MSDPPGPVLLAPYELAPDEAGTTRPPEKGASDRWPALLSRLSVVAAPILLSTICRNATALLVLAFVGHSGGSSLDIAAVGLGSVFTNVLGYSVLFGLAAGIDTLSTQAFGRGDLHGIGILMQRALAVVLCLAAVPMTILWLNAEAILIGLGQNVTLAAEVAVFSAWRVPGLWACAVFAVTVKTQFSMGLTWPSLVAQVISTSCGVLCAYFWIVHLKWPAVAGAALTNTVQDVVGAVLVVAIFVCNPQCRSCWPGVALRQSFRLWMPYLHLAAPACVMLCAEWWSWEIATFFAGLVSVDALSANTILTTICNFLYSLPASWGAAGTTVVGNLLGGSKPWAARRATAVLLAVGAAYTAAQTGCFWRLRLPIVSLFTDDAGVEKEIRQVLALAVAFQAADTVQTMITSVLIAAGKQALASKFLVLWYWVIGLPLAAALAFSRLQWGLFGVWVGMLAAVVLHALTYIAILLLLDWPLEASKASEPVVLKDEGQAGEAEAPLLL